MLKEWSDREPEDEPPYRTGWIPIAGIAGLSAPILGGTLAAVAWASTRHAANRGATAGWRGLFADVSEAHREAIKAGRGCQDYFADRPLDESWSRARQEGWREAKADHEVMA